MPAGSNLNAAQPPSGGTLTAASIISTVVPIERALNNTPTIGDGPSRGTSLRAPIVEYLTRNGSNDNDSNDYALENYQSEVVVQGNLNDAFYASLTTDPGASYPIHGLDEAFDNQLDLSSHATYGL